MLETAAAASDAQHVSVARCELTRLFFDEYAPAARRAQPGAPALEERRAERDALRHVAASAQTFFKGSAQKDETTGKRRASIEPSQADVDAGRVALRDDVGSEDGVGGLLHEGDEHFWALPSEGAETDSTYLAPAEALGDPLLRAFVRLESLERQSDAASGAAPWSDAPSGAAELPAMVARDGIVRGETVEVTMPRHERKKASHAASRYFLELLRALRAESNGGVITHFAFTDGSKIGAEASDDGKPHAACGVWEGPCRVGGGDDGLGGDNEVGLGLLDPPKAQRASSLRLRAAGRRRHAALPDRATAARTAPERAHRPPMASHG